MEKVNKYVKQASTILNNIMDELNFLEIEKKQLIARYKNATPKQKSLIEKQMLESENKFKNLYAAISELAVQVKSLKDDIISNTDK